MGLTLCLKPIFCAVPILSFIIKLEHFPSSLIYFYDWTTGRIIPMRYHKIVKKFCEDYENYSKDKFLKSFWDFYFLQFHHNCLTLG